MYNIVNGSEDYSFIKLLYIVKSMEFKCFIRYVNNARKLVFRKKYNVSLHYITMCTTSFYDLHLFIFLRIIRIVINFFYFYFILDCYI